MICNKKSVDIKVSAHDTFLNLLACINIKASSAPGYHANYNYFENINKTQAYLHITYGLSVKLYEVWIGIGMN
jgi:patatin-like phospholipase/acyl hydrolase